MPNRNGSVPRKRIPSPYLLSMSHNAASMQTDSTRVVNLIFFVLVMFVTYFLSDMSCLDDYNNLVFFRNIFPYLYSLYRRSLLAVVRARLPANPLILVFRREPPPRKSAAAGPGDPGRLQKKAPAGLKRSFPPGLLLFSCVKEKSTVPS